MIKPLGPIFSQLIKIYFAYLTKELSHLTIQRFYYPLYLIFEEHQAPSQKFLSEALEVDKVYMVRILDYLEQHQCIERIKDKKDRRVHRVMLTDKGTAYAEDIKKTMMQADELFLNVLEEPEKNNMKDNLMKISHELQHLTKSHIELTIKQK